MSSDEASSDSDTKQGLLTEQVEDLARILSRQADTLGRMADAEQARAARDRLGADMPLVVELFAILGDLTACAGTAESARERAAFEAAAARIERLLEGRGGTVVAPAVGDAFDPATMEAADVVDTDDPALDRTVDGVIAAGLSVPGRSVRPARVVVRRFRSR